MSHPTSSLPSFSQSRLRRSSIPFNGFLAQFMCSNVFMSSCVRSFCFFGLSDANAAFIHRLKRRDTHIQRADIDTSLLSAYLYNCNNK